ncbi:DNA endonuclease SmrA [Vibrio sp.]|nr:DNA endonuclease SmrA [Vibrio sp.]
MSQNDFALFQEMMGDVKPLDNDTVLHQKKYEITEAQLEKQKAAAWLTEHDPDHLSINHATMMKPDDLLEYKRDGVQSGVYRKLRLGKYPIQAKLDLHKHTLKEARNEIIAFLKQCMRLDIRTALIVHGKGERSTPQALMKSFLFEWLQQIKDVQCIHSAQRFHGGTGAVYIMLRKSQDKKLENKERHQKRMG